MIVGKFSVIAESLAKILYTIIALCDAHSEVYMERKPILRMPRVLRGVVTLPPAPDYGKPKKLDYFQEASGRITEAGDEFKIMDYGGLTVIDWHKQGRINAQIFESASGLLIIKGMLDITGRVRAFRSAVKELNMFVDWEKAGKYGLDKWQVSALLDKVKAWLDMLRGM